MSTLRNMFANDLTRPAVPDKLETAVNEVLREAEALCRVLRERRERQQPLRNDLA